MPAAGAQVNGHLHIRAGFKWLGLSRSPFQGHREGRSLAAVPHAPVGSCPGSPGFSASSLFEQRSASYRQKLETLPKATGVTSFAALGNRETHIFLGAATLPVQ